MTPVEQLVQLAREAEAKLSVIFDAPDALPFASEAFEIIAANPELQGEFEAAFLEMPPYAPTEFVEVCMHVLRWPNVRVEFEARQRAAIARNDWRTEPVYRHYLEAFEPDWEGEVGRLSRCGVQLSKCQVWRRNRGSRRGHGVRGRAGARPPGLSGDPLMNARLGFPMVLGCLATWLSS